MQHIQSAWSTYRYHSIFAAYVTITSVAIYRVTRLPYSTSIRSSQIETIFKATTLAAVIASIGVSGNLNKPRSGFKGED